MHPSSARARPWSSSASTSWITTTTKTTKVEITRHTGRIAEVVLQDRAYSYKVGDLGARQNRIHRGHQTDRRLGRGR